MTNKFRVCKLDPKAVLPVKNNPSDAGFDLTTIESVVLPPGQSARLRTGLSVAIPTGHVGLIWARSKLGAKKGIQILAGVIDTDYRGEIIIALLNSGLDPVELKAGDKVAQLILQEIAPFHVVEVAKLDDTIRGSKGINCTDLRL